MVNTQAFEEIAHFIAGISPAQVVAFHPSPEVQQRVSDLLDKERASLLSAEEKEELDDYLRLEHLMRLAKARARKNLNEAFEKDIIEILDGEYKIPALLEVIKKYKKSGIGQEEMLKELERIRHLKDEKFEDRILEVMDIISGFCRPDYRLW